MAMRSRPGLHPSEEAFLAENELVTVIARQRLEALQLLGPPTPSLRANQRADLPLWIAILLKRQGRVQIVCPDWLSVTNLQNVIAIETQSEIFSPTTKWPDELEQPLFSLAQSSSVALSPPFLPSSVSSSSAHLDASSGLPYHYAEIAHLLLNAASDDIPGSSMLISLLRELREVRAAKLRAGIAQIEGGREIRLNGIAALEVAEYRAFVTGLMDRLRKLEASREAVRREDEVARGGRRDDLDDEDEDMLDS